MKTIPIKAFFCLGCILSIFCLTSCGSKDDTLAVYPLKESFSYDGSIPMSGRYWIPMPPIRFKIYQDHVVTLVDGDLTKSNHCTIMSKRDWACRDSSSRFGFRDGVFFMESEEKDLKFVSMWQYNFLRCKLEFKINDSIHAAFNCISDWK